MFGIRLRMADVVETRRLSSYRFSPILVKFASTHSRSIMYDLLDPSLRPKMVDGKVFWNRHQTHYDHTVYKICQALRKRKEDAIKHIFVDKNHLTTIILAQGDHPVVVHDKESLPGLFNQDPTVLEILADYRTAFDDAPEESDDGGQEETAEPEVLSDTSAHTNII